MKHSCAKRNRVYPKVGGNREDAASKHGSQINSHRIKATPSFARLRGQRGANRLAALTDIFAHKTRMKLEDDFDCDESFIEDASRKLKLVIRSNIYLRNKACYMLKEKGERLKGKELLYKPLIAMLILSSIAIASAGAAEPPFATSPTVWVEDYTFFNELNLTSTYFNVSVNVWNATSGNTNGGVGAWELKLLYNTTLLDAVYVYNTSDTVICTDWVPVDGGAFQPDDFPTINDTYTADYGRIWVGALFPSGQEFTGNGTLVKIKFHISMAPPRDLVTSPENKTVYSDLNLIDAETKLKDPDGDPVTIGVEDGSYTYIRPQKVVGTPTAAFDWTPTAPYECDDVTLDAGDSDDGGAGPLSYLWTITNGTGGAVLTGANNTETTIMHCTGAGTVNVTLYVENQLPLNDTVTHEIEQYAKVGCILDVYTSQQRFCGQTTTNVGKGNWTNADAFAPGDNMTLYASVTYNGAPVNHVLVSFEVWDNQGRCVTYRVNETNKDGITSTYFRIAVPCDEQLFGKWTVIVTCKVQSVKQEDRLKFDVGYILQITDAYTTFQDSKETVFYRECEPEEEIDFHLTIKNIAWISKNVTIVIVVYDECSVPLGQVIVNMTMPGGAYCNPCETNVTIQDTIKVPQWAYVGIGKVYYNLFTRLPSQCGVAYSPEYSTGIVIKLGPRP